MTLLRSHRGRSAANLEILAGRHATIVHDEKRGTYTIVSAQPVTVNNHRYTKRPLEAGDVIELPGATIVFDEPEAAPKPEKR